MPDQSSYKIDQVSAECLDRVVRQVLGSGDRTSALNPPPRDQDETCWARLTNRVTDGWEWEEVRRQKANDGTLTWETVENGRTGDNTKPERAKALAIEIVPGTGSVQAVTLLRRLNIKKLGASESDEPTWNGGWAIVSDLPAPTKKYQVLTPIDDTLRPVWTTARFTDDT